MKTEVYYVIQYKEYMTTWVDIKRLNPQDGSPGYKSLSALFQGIAQCKEPIYDTWLYRIVERTIEWKKEVNDEVLVQDIG